MRDTEGRKDGEGEREERKYARECEMGERKGGSQRQRMRET